MKDVIFICGPMTGLPQSNYPAFHAAAAHFRALGHSVENPADNPPCDTWEGYMRLSIPQLLRSDVIAVLPGHENSKGARLELHNAKELGMRVIYLVDQQSVTAAPSAV